MLRHSWYNLALGHISLTKLGYNWLLVSGDIDDGRWKDVVEEDRSTGGEKLVINIPTVRGWYLWVDKTSLRACLFFCRWERWGLYKNGV